MEELAARFLNYAIGYTALVLVVVWLGSLIYQYPWTTVGLVLLGLAFIALDQLVSRIAKGIEKFVDSQKESKGGKRN